MVEALAVLGRGADPVVRDGVRWLLANQEKDGSWFGRWGANHVYGTGAVVPALVAAGVPANHPALRRAARWLEEHQNADGGWGEDMRSYTDPRWIGVGTSTASQTGWALMALIALGRHATDAVRNGIDHLSATQRPDGSWPLQVRDGRVEDAGADTNFCAYPAVGVWHHVLLTGE